MVISIQATYVTNPANATASAGQTLWVSGVLLVPSNKKKPKYQEKGPSGPFFIFQNLWYHYL